MIVMVLVLEHSVWSHGLHVRGLSRHSYLALRHISARSQRRSHILSSTYLPGSIADWLTMRQSQSGRAPKACDKCRRYKTRCYAGDNAGGPCLRCRTLSVQCSLELEGSAPPAKRQRNLHTDSHRSSAQLSNPTEDRLEAINGLPEFEYAADLHTLGSSAWSEPWNLSSIVLMLD